MTPPTPRLDQQRAVAEPEGGRAALEQLGGPGERLDSGRWTVPRAASEWLYAERGLAVFVDPETDCYRRTPVAERQKAIHGR
jgi:hypothetical protein